MPWPSTVVFSRPAIGFAGTIATVGCGRYAEGEKTIYVLCRV